VTNKKFLSIFSTVVILIFFWSQFVWAFGAETYSHPCPYPDSISHSTSQIFLPQNLQNQFQNNKGRFEEIGREAIFIKYVFLARKALPLSSVLEPTSRISQLAIWAFLIK